MKSKEQIDLEIKKISDNCADLDKNQAGYEKKKKDSIERIKFLRECKLFLETQPTIDLLKRTATELELKVALVVDSFPSDNYRSLPISTFRKLKKEHEKAYDLQKIKKQLNTINFLMD